MAPPGPGRLPGAAPQPGHAQPRQPLHRALLRRGPAGGPALGLHRGPGPHPGAPVPGSAPPPQLRRPGVPPPTNSWDPVERFEVGCEHIQTDPDQRLEADRELAGLLMAVPALLGLEGCLLHIGHAALLRRPLEAEQIPAELGLELARVLDRRAIHRAAELLDGHPAKDRLLAHAEILLSGPDGPGSLDDLARGPYGGLLEAEAGAAAPGAGAALGPPAARPHPAPGPGRPARARPSTPAPPCACGPPGAQRELAAGGRYDGLFPEMGRPWYAAGFCVRLTTLLELGDDQGGRVTKPLLIALPKGRLEEELLPRLQGSAFELDAEGPQVAASCASPWPTPSCPPSCSRAPTCPATWPAAWRPWGWWARTSWTRPRWTSWNWATWTSASAACPFAPPTAPPWTSCGQAAPAHRHQVPGRHRALAAPGGHHRRAGAPAEQRGAGPGAGPGRRHRRPGAERADPPGPPPGRE